MKHEEFIETNLPRMLFRRLPLRVHDAQRPFRPRENEVQNIEHVAIDVHNFCSVGLCLKQTYLEIEY